MKTSFSTIPTSKDHLSNMVYLTTTILGAPPADHGDSAGGTHPSAAPPEDDHGETNDPTVRIAEPNATLLNQALRPSDPTNPSPTMAPSPAVARSVLSPGEVTTDTTNDWPAYDESVPGTPLLDPKHSGLYATTSQKNLASNTGKKQSTSPAKKKAPARRRSSSNLAKYQQDIVSKADRKLMEAKHDSDMRYLTTVAEQFHPMESSIVQGATALTTALTKHTAACNPTAVKPAFDVFLASYCAFLKLSASPLPREVEEIPAHVIKLLKSLNLLVDSAVPLQTFFDALPPRIKPLRELIELLRASTHADHSETPPSTTAHHPEANSILPDPSGFEDSDSIFNEDRYVTTVQPPTVTRTNFQTPPPTVARHRSQSISHTYRLPLNSPLIRTSNSERTPPASMPQQPAKPAKKRLHSARRAGTPNALSEITDDELLGLGHVEKYQDVTATEQTASPMSKKVKKDLFPELLSDPALPSDFPPSAPNSISSPAIAEDEELILPAAESMLLPPPILQVATKFIFSDSSTVPPDPSTNSSVMSISSDEMSACSVEPEREPVPANTLHPADVVDAMKAVRKLYKPQGSLLQSDLINQFRANTVLLRDPSQPAAYHARSDGHFGIIDSMIRIFDNDIFTELNANYPDGSIVFQKASPAPPLAYILECCKQTSHWYLILGAILEFFVTARALLQIKDLPQNPSPTFSIGPHGTLLQELAQRSDLRKHEKSVTYDTALKDFRFWNLMDSLPCRVIPDGFMCHIDHIPHNSQQLRNAELFRADHHVTLQMLSQRARDTYDMERYVEEPPTSCRGALLNFIYQLEYQLFDALNYHCDMPNRADFTILPKPSLDFTNETFFPVPTFADIPTQTLERLLDRDDPATHDEDLPTPAASIVHVLSYTPYGTAADYLVQNEEAFPYLDHRDLLNMIEFVNPTLPCLRLDAATIPTCARLTVVPIHHPHSGQVQPAIAYIGRDENLPYPYVEHPSELSPRRVTFLNDESDMYSWKLHYRSNNRQAIVSNNGQRHTLDSIAQLLHIRQSVLVFSLNTRKVPYSPKEFDTMQRPRYCLKDDITKLPFHLATKFHRSVVTRNGKLALSWSLRVSSEYMDATLGFDPFPPATYYHASHSHPEYNAVVHGFGYHPPTLSEPVIDNDLAGEHSSCCNRSPIVHNTISHLPPSQLELSTVPKCSSRQPQSIDPPALPIPQHSIPINVYESDPVPFSPLTKHRACMVVVTRNRADDVTAETVDDDGNSIAQPTNVDVPTSTSNPTSTQNVFHSPAVASMPSNESHIVSPDTLFQDESPFPLTQGISAYEHSPLDAIAEKMPPASVLDQLDDRKMSAEPDLTQSTQSFTTESEPPLTQEFFDPNKTIKEEPSPLTQNTSTPFRKPTPPSAPQAERSKNVYSFKDFYDQLPIHKRAAIYDSLTEEQQNDVARDQIRRSLNRPTTIHIPRPFTPIPQPWFSSNTETETATEPETASAPQDEHTRLLNKILSSKPKSKSTKKKRYSRSEEEDSDDQYASDDDSVERDCPSSAYLTKILTKQAKNSRLKTLGYSSNLETRRQQFNRFIDNLMIVTHISPWTSPIFSSWPTEINCKHPNVSTAIYNIIHSYVSDDCQTLLLDCNADGEKAIFTLRRHCAPLAAHHIDKVDDKFRGIKQHDNESATSYFKRIRELSRDCYHAGIDKHDDDTLLRRALQGANEHPMYDTTYKSFQRIYASSRAGGPEKLTFIDVESAMHNIDDDKGITTTNNQRRNFNAFLISPARNNSNPRLSSNRNTTRPGNTTGNENKHCSYCNRRYHTYNECRKRQSEQRNGSRNRFPRRTPNSEQRRHRSSPNDRNARPPPPHSRNRVSFQSNNNPRRHNTTNSSTTNNNSSNRSSNYSLSLICNACGQRGHFAANCPNNGRNDRNSNSTNRSRSNLRPSSQRSSSSSNQRTPTRHTALNVYTEDHPSTPVTEQFHQAFAVSNQDDIGPRDATDPPLMDYYTTEEPLNMSYETAETYASSIPTEHSSPFSVLSDPGVLPALQTLLPHSHNLSDHNYQPDDPLSSNQRYGPPELRNWIPDSGATLHFTPEYTDIIHPRPVDFEVTMADGTPRRATARGEVMTRMITDQGVASIFLIKDVYYVPGLSHRLLSLNCISSTHNHSIRINNRATVIRFPDQSTFTWPMRAPSDPDEDTRPQVFLARHVAIHPPSPDEAPPPDAHQEESNNLPADPDSNTSTSKTISRNTQKGPTIPAELMSRRMGFRTLKTLLTGSLHNCWRDSNLAPGTHRDNWPVQVSISHKHARGKAPFQDGPSPFYTLHYDLIRNPFRFGLSTKSYFKAYLLIVATPGRLIGWKGLEREDTKAIIKAQKEFLTETRLLGRIDNVHFIRTDAGSAFMSELFIDACNDLGIKVEAAAPKHQEMNSICEAKWKQLHTTANTMLNNARLGGAFYHHAHKYAAAVLNALPARNVVDNDGLPSTPYFVSYGRKPAIRNFRIFGCPVYVKRYTPSHDGTVITYKQQIQRATRGIFVGFPDNSAGWLIYCPELPSKFLISHDVQFDENFESALVFDTKPYAGTVPIRPQLDPNALTSHNNTQAPAQTGSVGNLGIETSNFHADTQPTSTPPSFDIENDDLEYSSSDDDSESPSDNDDDSFLSDYNNYPDYDDDSLLDDDDDLTSRTANTTCADDIEDDLFVTPLPVYIEEPDTSDTSCDQQVHISNMPIPPLPRRVSSRRNKGHRPNRLINALNTMHTDFNETREWSPTYEPGQVAMLALDQQHQSQQPQRTSHPIDMYLPEPQSFKAVLSLDPSLRDPWITAIRIELKNLIDNKTFYIGHQPRPDELIMLTKLVLKAKQTSSGALDKLKARVVARGDMEKRHHRKLARKRQKQNDALHAKNEQNIALGLAPHHIPAPAPIEDTWTPCATSRGVKLLIACLCSARRTVKGADFVGAYLQANVVGRHFVKLPIEYADIFPEYKEYFGVPLLLGKGIYGITYAGKWWNIEFSEWLLSQGFVQSSADPTYFVKRYKNGQWLRLTFFVDDLLYAGSNDKVEREFEEITKKRFDIKFTGDAQWFLQMRIHKHKNETYTLDQHRFVVNTLKRYDPRDEYKMRDTPLPPDYIYSKENRPADEAATALVNHQYAGLNFRSAVCTLLYLAYNTRADIIFAVTKLSKACLHPGRLDYEALIHLLGYIKYKPDLAITFYPDRTQNPIHDLCTANNIPFSDLTIFTDASWQDCPDTGRSTVGYMIFYRGALIEANSTVPSPVAMATSEAEYMGACCGTMAAAHIRMILYDILYLGTPRWNEAVQDLPTTPIVLMIDNSAAVQIAKNGKLGRKSRHIERRFHWVKTGQQLNLHSLHWLSGQYMLADVLTKSQVASKIDPHLPYIFTTLPKHLTQT